METCKCFTKIGQEPPRFVTVHGVCEKPSQVKVKVVFLSAVWYTGQAVKILKKQKAVLSEKRTKRRNEVYYGFGKNERGRRGWKDHSWY